jgi:hypothetical protein
VVDNAPRLVLDHYDARKLAAMPDVLIVLEWDIAATKEDLGIFAAAARLAPRRVLVAPYRLYPEANPGLTEPIWAHRREPGNVPVRAADATCHRFGFGMVYLPRLLLRAFADDWLAANPNGNLTDETFSGWHYRTNPDPEVPICWAVRPVHLNYAVPTEL